MLVLLIFTAYTGFNGALTCIQFKGNKACVNRSIHEQNIHPKLTFIRAESTQCHAKHRLPLGLTRALPVIYPCSWWRHRVLPVVCSLLDPRTPDIHLTPLAGDLSLVASLAPAPGACRAISPRSCQGTARPAICAQLAQRHRCRAPHRHRMVVITPRPRPPRAS